ncbi:hypothetical protein OJAV_G00057430 [Oryzias javanicus]|uniref:Uncharacterized protein n=1 Tax=Oryzias javanicus TaxID=123683 RepID=A0A3S2N2H8_ORYJA|nr:hypothetical protein OJAV_G00057430 [Oryzias javanicus]
MPLVTHALTGARAEAASFSYENIDGAITPERKRRRRRKRRKEGIQRQSTRRRRPTSKTSLRRSSNL